MDHTGEVRLRPHHLLCLQGFQGYGYDDGLVAHLRKITDRLARDNPPVRIVSGADDVCACCSRLSPEGVCDGEAAIAQMDANALRVYGIAYGDAHPWRDWLSRVNAPGVRCVLREKVCAGCQWITVCLWYNPDETTATDNMTKKERD